MQISFAVTVQMGCAEVGPKENKKATVGYFISV
jgi:hypothetical protein